jgi:peptidoglycan/LPS O-acetylase OafA/YrhL
LNQIPTSQRKTDYFPNLDGFRTVAFLIVFLGHCFILFDYGEKNQFYNVLGKLFGKPGAGVHFFFVLSGFLISYLLLKEIGRNNKIDIKAFYIRRVLRIWPVYYTVIIAALLLSFVPRLFYSLHDANFWMIGLFFTNYNLAHTGISSLPITVLWSVSVEEQFYLVLPLLISLFTKKVFYVFPLFIIAAIIFGVVHTHNIRLVEFSTISVCGSLFLGCISAYLVIYHRLADFFLHLKKGYIIAMYFLFFVLHIYREKIFSPDKSNIWLYLIYSFFFAFFILEQNYSVNSFFKMKNLKMLTSWGKYTYGLYAYHITVISLFMIFIPDYIDPGKNLFIYFTLWIISLLISLVIAKLSYQFIETPFLKMKDRFSR